MVVLVRRWILRKRDRASFSWFILLLLSATSVHAIVSAEHAKADGSGHVHHASEATSSKKKYFDAAEAPRFHFYSHHKAGTVMGYWLLWHFQDAVNRELNLDPAMRLGLVKWLTVMPGSASWAVTSRICPELGYPAAIDYEDMRVNSYNLIQRRCPNRAVHMIRNAQSQLVSNYVYTKHLQPGDDVPADVELGRILRRRSVRWGIERMCERYFEVYHPQMVEMHELLMRSKPENVLEVRYEDFQTDFNGTARRLFTHLVPNATETDLEDLLINVASVNPRTWTNADRHADSHISSRAEKARVREIALQMAKQDTPAGWCLRNISDVSVSLGYDADGNVIPSDALSPEKKLKREIE